MLTQTQGLLCIIHISAQTEKHGVWTEAAVLYADAHICSQKALISINLLLLICLLHGLVVSLL